MSSWYIEDGQKEIAEIKTIEELVTELMAIREKVKSQNIIVILVHPDGHYMHIGLSDGEGFLNYHKASEEPPYYSSIGNKSLEFNDGVRNFYLNGYLSEIPLRNCIPFETQLDVIKDFFITGKLSNKIDWEED